MTIEPYVYRNRILQSINNRIIEFTDGTFRSDNEWFNQEDLLRTMKRQKRGMDKSRLRDFLDELVELELLEIREGKKQDKSNSKGEYKITTKGTDQLKLLTNLS